MHHCCSVRRLSCNSHITPSSWINPHKTSHWLDDRNSHAIDIPPFQRQARDSNFARLPKAQTSAAATRNLAGQTAKATYSPLGTCGYRRTANQITDQQAIQAITCHLTFTNNPAAQTAGYERHVQLLFHPPVRQHRYRSYRELTAYHTPATSNQWIVVETSG
jgi:hypothetical protein